MGEINIPVLSTEGTNDPKKVKSSVQAPED